MTRRINTAASILLLLGATSLVVAQSDEPAVPASNESSGLVHANGDPLRAADGPYDSRTEAGRKEIEWLEKRLLTDILVALTDVDVMDIVVDVLAQTVVVVVDYSETFDDAMKTRIVDTCILFTNFERERVIILKTAYEE